jgi:hypothetical protein
VKKGREKGGEGGRREGEGKRKGVGRGDIRRMCDTLKKLK